jgi:hypothetical protein
MNELTQHQHLPMNTFEDMKQLGDELAKSGMFGVKTSAGGVALLVTSVQTGMSIFDINRKYHIMSDGKMSMKADAMLAEFKRLGGKCQWQKFDATEAKAIWSYAENKDLEVSYTIEDAKNDNIPIDKAGSAWKNSRADMLRARLITKTLRMICPEVNHGVYTPEEVAEFVVEDGPVTQEPKRVNKPAKAKVVKPEPVEADVEDAEEVTDFDYGLCPVDGAMCGKKWADMPLEHLKLAMKLKDPMMEKGHFEAIEAEIEKKLNNNGE